MEMIVYLQTGSPPHIHSREDESFSVQSGEVQFQNELPLLESELADKLLDNTFRFRIKRQNLTMNI
ncbi:MAG TPA: hypothetical protein V6C78_35235 [Crinalium sp.]|jgi:hypothetical protein